MADEGNKWAEEMSDDERRKIDGATGFIARGIIERIKFLGADPVLAKALIIESAIRALMSFAEPSERSALMREMAERLSEGADMDSLRLLRPAGKGN